jgi:hypothetical protein
MDRRQEGASEADTEELGSSGKGLDVSHETILGGWPRRKALRRFWVPHTPVFVCGFRLSFMHNVAETGKDPTAREFETKTSLSNYRGRYYDPSERRGG